MGKVTLLFAGKSYDTDVQSVRENQIVIFDGPYNMRQRMVVAGIAHTQSGYNYRLIDPETAEEHSADLIRPLRDKFGIGHYYDDEHPEFMDAAEVAALRTRADALKAEQEAARRAAAEDAERLRTIGAERLRQIVPDDAVAVIIGEQHESECDPYTDYFGSRIVRTVILGFSTHTRDLFPEMRKAAARFEGTAHLAERNAPSTNTVKSTAWGTAITLARTAIRAGRSARNRAATKRALSSVSPSWPEIPRTCVSKTLHPCRPLPPKPWPTHVSRSWNTPKSRSPYSAIRNPCVTRSAI